MSATTSSVHTFAKEEEAQKNLALAFGNDTINATVLFNVWGRTQSNTRNYKSIIREPLKSTTDCP